MRSKIVSFFLLLTLLFASQLNGQSKFSDNFKIMGNYHYGYVLPEYSFVNLISNAPISSFDLCLLKETKGKNIWQQLYKYPEYGLSFFYSSLGNDDVLGREIALNYFFKVHLISKKRFKFFNRTGIGLGYVSEKFDLEENYLNVATGSHLNMHFNFRFGASYEFTDKLGLNAGISFDHFSNANTSEPNLGINYFTGYTGISYLIGERKEITKIELEDHKIVNEFEAFVSLGGKHARNLSSKYFLVSSLSLQVKRSFFRAFHLGAGVDLFYDSSVSSQLDNDVLEYKSAYQFQTGIHISQSIIYSRFSVTLQEGIYLGLKEKVDDYVMYNRGILRYQLTENTSIRLAMKSHLHILDYPEIGLGFKL